MPKIVDHDQKRQELLLASLPLFATEGYGNLSVRQLATSLGVTTGVLYHYFDNKEALFEQLMAFIQDRQLQLIRMQFPQVTSKISVLEVFLKLFGTEVKQVLQVVLDYHRLYPSSNIPKEILLGYQEAFLDILQTSPEQAQTCISIILGGLFQQIWGLDTDIIAQLQQVLQEESSS